MLFFIIHIILSVIFYLITITSFIIAFIKNKKEDVANKWIIIASISSAVIGFISIFNIKVPCPTIYPIDNESKIYSDDIEITIDSWDCFKTYYSLNGDDPKFGKLYENKFIISESTTVSTRNKFLFWWSDISQQPYVFEPENSGLAEILYDFGYVVEDNKEILNKYIQQANKCYENEDYESALELYQKAVDLGDEQFLYQLSYLYYGGKGLTPDYEKAYTYAKQADEKLNSAEAQNLLGVMYEEGKFLKKDLVKAANYYEKSANNGLDKAKYNLGRFYFLHYNNFDDDNKMYNLFNDTKETVTQSKEFIALCYLEGRGITKNEDIGMQYFEKITKGNKSLAMYLIGRKYEALQLEQNAFEWYLKASELGCNIAMERLANCYKEGIGVTRDTNESQKWYQLYGLDIQTAPGLWITVIDNKHLPQENVLITVFDNEKNIIFDLYTDEGGKALIGPLDDGFYYYEVNNGEDKKFAINEIFRDGDIQRRYVRKTEIIE